MPYIEEASARGEEHPRQDENSCFLCAAQQGTEDKEKLVLSRAPLSFVIMNLYPYNNGHLLVTPNRHISDLNGLSHEELADLFELTRRAVSWLEKAYQPHGFNVGINLGRVAGAGLPGHMHVHIVPRWNGDTNFMPVLGHTKVISQGLEATYTLLSKIIAEEVNG
jgi:ATP adenylyltransferase